MTIDTMDPIGGVLLRFIFDILTREIFSKLRSSPGSPWYY